MIPAYLRSRGGATVSVAVAGLANVSEPCLFVSNLLKESPLSNRTSDVVRWEVTYQQVVFSPSATATEAKAMMAMRTRGENILADLKWWVVGGELISVLSTTRSEVGF